MVLAIAFLAAALAAALISWPTVAAFLLAFAGVVVVDRLTRDPLDIEQDR